MLKSWRVKCSSFITVFFFVIMVELIWRNHVVMGYSDEIVRGYCKIECIFYYHMWILYYMFFLYFYFVLLICHVFFKFSESHLLAPLQIFPLKNHYAILKGQIFFLKIKWNQMLGSESACLILSDHNFSFSNKALKVY